MRLASLCALIIALARTGATGQGAAPPDPFAAALTSGAAPLQAAGIVEIKGFPMGGGLVEWDVWFDRARLLESLGLDPGSGAEDPSRARMLAWYRTTAAALADIAADAARNADRNPAFDPETDMAVEFTGANFGGEFRIGSQECVFKGSRITYIGSPPDGFVPDPPAEVKGVLAEVEIVPDKLVWRPGEELAGVFIVRNAGSKRLTVRYMDMPDVTVLDAQGNTPPRFDTRAFICGTGAAGAPPIAIDPGKEYRGQFTIRTDPLSDIGGFNLAPGRYRLTFPDLAARLNIATRVRPAPIEVRAGKGMVLGSRIIRFSAAPDRITILREDGTIESHDLATGEIAAWATIPGYVTPERWSRNDALSPDGSVFVRARINPQTREQELLDFVRPDATGGTLSTITVPGDPAKFARECRPQGFSADGDRVRIYRGDEGLHELDLDTGEWAAVPCPDDEDRWFELSPDGQYVLTGGSQARPRAGGEAVSLDPPGDASSSLSLAGVNGLYMGCEGGTEVVLAGYDGTARTSLPTTAWWPQSESADGRYVALSSISRYDFTDEHKTGRIEVWDVRAQKRTLTIDDGKFREAAFAGASPVLVCGVVVRGSTDVSWFDDSFEVYDAEKGTLLHTLRLTRTSAERDAPADR